MKKIYEIDEELFCCLNDLAEEISGNMDLIKDFCLEYKDIDQFGRIIPLIKYTHKAAYNLYSKLLKIELNETE